MFGGSVPDSQSFDEDSRYDVTAYPRRAEWNSNKFVIVRVIMIVYITITTYILNPYVTTDHLRLNSYD